MSFIPIDESGKQAYTYDDRSLKVKVSMWLWKHVGIPLFGEVNKGKTYFFKHVTGDKTRYVNCTFKHCRFEGLKLVFINDCYIEYSTVNPEFTNIKECWLWYIVNNVIV